MFQIQPFKFMNFRHFLLGFDCDIVIHLIDDRTESTIWQGSYQDFKSSPHKDLLNYSMKHFCDWSVKTDNDYKRVFVVVRIDP